MEQTITAIATANGVGAINIIRVSGSQAIEVAKTITQKLEFKNRYAHYLPFFNLENILIDKGILIYFKAPFSFTGEDVVEFQIHGGVGVSEALLETILNSDFNIRLAEAGEFTKRAFLNGKIDYSQVEAIGELINTKSKEAVAHLGKQLNGDLKNLVDEVRQELIDILAQIEVNIDYAEEDLPQNMIEAMHINLNQIQKKFEQLLSMSKKRFTLLEGFKVAIVGRPNVGKSSLLNALLNYQRAIVSNIEGTTRDTVEEYFKLGSHLIKIVDTAGIRDNSKDEIENIGIEKSLQAIEEADIILTIFDSSEKLTPNDKKIISKIKNFQNKEIIFIFNKSDLASKIEFNLIESELNLFEKKPNIVNISAKNSFDSIEKLEEQLIKIMDLNSVPEDSMILTTSRQVKIVKEILENIINAQSEIDLELELFAFSINQALKKLSEISKPYEYNQMLDSMFGNFCLGK